MTSPNDVVLHLASLARDLEAATRQLSQLDEAAVRARGRFEVKFAEAFLTSDGAMDVRKQQAILATADAKLDAEIGEQRVRSQRELIRTIQTRIDVGRTMSATVRSEISLAGVGT